MVFKNIRNAVLDEYKKRLTIQEEKIKTEEGLNYCVKWVLNKRISYKGSFEEQQKKCLIALQNKYNKECLKELDFIKSIEESDDLRNPLIITIEWKKSRMWGMNPKAYTNYGFEGESVGGCGYCKLSTATAQALNSNKAILKLLFKKEERRLKEGKAERRAYIGYGSGYYAIPRFEGGVGVSSHEHIINGLGLKWENVTDTSQTNVYRIALN